jgi:hypothetical protein
MLWHASCVWWRGVGVGWGYEISCVLSRKGTWVHGYYCAGLRLSKAFRIKITKLLFSLFCFHLHLICLSFYRHYGPYWTLARVAFYWPFAIWTFRSYFERTVFICADVPLSSVTKYYLTFCLPDPFMSVQYILLFNAWVLNHCHYSKVLLSVRVTTTKYIFINEQLVFSTSVCFDRIWLLSGHPLTNA